MQVFDRGLKRRLPTMLGGDPRRIRMAYSLLFALPGTPSIFYGEEIGMGENLAEDGRMAVRTPMQWTAEDGGGFSSAERRSLVSPLPEDGYGPAHVNVADQRSEPDSHYSFIRGLIYLYRRHPELGWGSVEIVDQPDEAVLVLACRWEEGLVITAHNLSQDGRTVEISVAGVEKGSRLVDLWEQRSLEEDPTKKFELQLDGYGYRRLRVQSEEDHRLY
ncbi:hypothetical protein GCM10025883_40770 [Mobilicoccus caccae]|uniref:Trehalose synthase n=1 Tax=Mobilicoccus caccae TaxID=1859295 RepID=A0ABQ6IXY6_9MICO|nr:hypothetical protein GCM10025883_40770 [Mobilicoccus caccae]